MLVVLHDRTAIRAISPKLEAEFDKLCGTISQTFTKEHTAQGAHTVDGFSIVAIQAEVAALTAAVSAIQQSSWITVKKSTDEARSNNGGSGAGVVVDDGELKFALAANTAYTIRGTIYFEVSAVGTELKYRISGPASPTRVQGEMRHPTNISLPAVFRAYASVNERMVPFSGDTNGYGVAYLDLLVLNGANSGTFSFQWVSSVATASSVTVKKGSFLEYIRQ